MRNSVTHFSLCLGRNYGTLVCAGLAAAVFLLAADRAPAERITVPLDGAWSVGESLGAEEVPADFAHTVAVPGLTNQAKPPFPEIDQY